MVAASEFLVMATQDGDFCVYRPTKIDEVILHELRIVAAQDRTSIQEILSDLGNEYIARRKNRKLIKRKPAPPKGPKKRS